jgi:glucan 1,3-beta-glucosidase
MVAGGAGAMAIEACQAACHDSGYSLAGVEYGQECYCDNTLQHGGGPAPDGGALCNMACAGNSAETCGGPNRLDLYQCTVGSSTSGSAVATSTGGSKK